MTFLVSLSIAVMDVGRFLAAIVLGFVTILGTYLTCSILKLSKTVIGWRNGLGLAIFRPPPPVFVFSQVSENAANNRKAKTIPIPIFGLLTVVSSTHWL